MIKKLVSLKGFLDQEGDIYPKYKEKVHMMEPKLNLGIKFPNPQVFREFLKEYNVFNCHDIKYIKNESVRIRHRRSWRVHASPIWD